MIDDADLREFVCIPGTKGINVQHLSYQRRDGTEFAVAQRHSKGFLGKLARYTGTDQTRDRTILFHPATANEPAFKVLCQALGPQDGVDRDDRAASRIDLRPIRLGDDRYVFDLAGGERVGQVSRPNEEDGTRLLLDGDETRVGVVLPTRPKSEDVSVLDMVDEIAEGGSDVGTQAWMSALQGHHRAARDRARRSAAAVHRRVPDLPGTRLPAPRENGTSLRRRMWSRATERSVI